MFFCFAVQRLSRGLRFKEWLNLAKDSLPIQPLGDRTRIIAIVGGLILICIGVMLLATAIKAQVWEGESIFDQFFAIYSTIYFGLATLGLVVRDFRLVHYGVNRHGTSSRQLTAEQIESIRRALEDHDFRAAVKRYCEAVPDAGSAEAKQYVLHLFHSLRLQEPDKYGPPPLSLATLNWKAMLICALIEAIALGVMWCAMPPRSAAMSISQFASSFLLGVGLMAGVRVKGLRKRLLLLIPAMARDDPQRSNRAAPD